MLVSNANNPNLSVAILPAMSRQAICDLSKKFLAKHKKKKTITYTKQHTHSL
jgi:hypothetical protein